LKKKRKEKKEGAAWPIPTDPSAWPGGKKRKKERGKTRQKLKDLWRSSSIEISGGLKV
jgi:hypothetical protein